MQYFYQSICGMKRIDIIKEIVKYDGLIVANLGYPSRELCALADSERNFYMLGSMGLASSVGLGIALEQKQRVYVIDGDGSVLMNLGTLATIAHYAPPNYCLVIVDNKVYGSTGNQNTYTAKKTDLVKIAKGAGCKNVKRAADSKKLKHLLQSFSASCIVIVADAEAANEDVPPVPLSPSKIRDRFMANIIKGNNYSFKD